MENGKFIHVYAWGQWFLEIVPLPFSGVLYRASWVFREWPQLFLISLWEAKWAKVPQALSLPSALHPSPEESHHSHLPLHPFTTVLFQQCSLFCSHLDVCLVFCCGACKDPQTSRDTISHCLKHEGKTCVTYSQELCPLSWKSMHNWSVFFSFSQTSGNLSWVCYVPAKVKQLWTCMIFPGFWSVWGQLWCPVSIQG